ncbi:hypothetical protein ARMSODRAFT_1022190 [Armillaria solidipes]|uniref:Uncharacterized protein n=1 Tax=Armillaria solidipes TaxID=1076256 RepID=A0A2H3B7V7_9AGAR|nr:hypothetical protein ARMSODRAFT_1022190 [Armillaria solidipes]
MFQEPPPPAYSANKAQDYGRYVQTRFRTPPPDSHATCNAPPPVQALIPERILPHPSTASSIRVGFPDHLAPYPVEDNDSDSSDYGGNEPIAEQEDNDPLNAYGGDYEVPMGYYLAITRGPLLPRRGIDAALEARIFANRERTDRPWQTPYSPSHWQRETAQTWTEPPHSEDFGVFNYDCSAATPPPSSGATGPPINKREAPMTRQPPPEKNDFSKLG